MNTIDSAIAALDVQLAEQQALWNGYSEEFNSVYSSQGNYTHPRAVQLKALREQTESRIQELRDRRAKLLSDRDTYNAALADAARLGLTGEAAELAAAAKVEQEKGRRNLFTIAGIGLLILLVVAAFVWYRRKR